MATLELTHSSLVKLIAYSLHYGRKEYAALTPGQKGVVDQVLDSGYRLLLYPDPLPGKRNRHRWSFLWPESSLTLSEDYSTGTVTVTPDAAGSIVTGVATAWDTVADLVSDAADWEFTPTGGETYTVKSYTGALEIKLDDTAVTVAAGTTYKLGRAKYSMPTGFGGLEGQMTYKPTTAEFYYPIRFTSWARIRRLRQLNGATAGRPTEACLLPAAAAPTAAQKWKIVFDLHSNGDYQLYYRYKVSASAIDSTNIYPICGAAHSETLLAACLYAAARFLNEDVGRIESARNYYMTRLTASVAEDEAMIPENLGSMRSDGVARRHDDTGVVPTYNGVPIG